MSISVTMRKPILLLPLLLLVAVTVSFAQTSSKSKSKDRFREKDDPRFPVRIKNIKEINSETPDYAPAYYKDGLLFVSNRNKKGVRDPRTKETYSKHYYAPFDPNGDPAPPQDFSINLSSSLNDGPVTFTRDYKTMYFTQNNNKNGVQKAGDDGKVRLKIYEARAGKDDWDLVGELPFNNANYSCFYPSLNSDGTKLFFASDMPGGEGGFDIWVVEKTPDGEWSAPKNLGNEINTPGQEICPFISLSGSLFFSSNGRELSMGGLDLYFVNNPLDHPDEVINLGAPFNSEVDDISLIVGDDGKSGFFASDRKGYGKNDIWKFTAERGIQGIGKPLSNRGDILVTDAKTGQPLQYANIHVLLTSEDGFVNSKADFYSMDLLPVQDRPNALNLQLVRKDAADMGQPEYMSNSTGRATADLVRFRSYMVLVSLDGYLTEQRLFYNDYDTPLDLKFPLRPKINCLRAGGLVLTQDFGTRMANARVKFVHEATGYEEPVRTNLNGEYDACLPYEGKYVVFVERDGFKPENFRYDAKKGERGFQETRMRAASGSTAVEDVLPLSNGVMEGSVLVMDQIFYELNKSTLNYSAIRHLEALLDLLKRYPEMEIDLAVHADPRGDSSQNQALTDERAKNAKTYLVYRGIAPERINAVGKGETEPVNRCGSGVECSEEDYKKNNRIEVRIRKLGAIPRP